MGVSASGATLEIQLVADVARLKRDMADMRQAIGQATGGAASSFDQLGKGSVAAAAAAASSAQKMARAAMTGAGGIRSMGSAATNSNIAMMEMFHITRNVGAQLAAGANPVRAFAMEIGRFSTAIQYSNGGLKGLVAQFLTLTGIIKVTRDTELEATAAASAASAQAVSRTAERAAAALAAKETQAALAKAELEGATSAEAEAAAQERLVAAYRAVEVAAGKAAIANEAAASAAAEAATASAAAAAAETTALGPLAVVVGGIALTLGVLIAAFADVKAAAEATDPGAKQLIANLGLTDAQIKKLKDTTVTWGDVTKATFQVLAEKAGINAVSISSFFSKAFHEIGEFGKFSVAIILAAFGAMVKGTADVITRLPAIVGGGVAAAANLGVAAIESLINFGIHGIDRLTDAVNASLLGQAIEKIFGTSLPHFADVALGRIKNNFAGTMASIGADVSGTFHSIFNATENTFDQIAQRASKIRDDRVTAEAATLKTADDATTRALTGGHHARAAAANAEAAADERLKKARDALFAKPLAVGADIIAAGKDKGEKMPGLEDMLGHMPDLGKQLLQTLKDIADQGKVAGEALAASFGKAGGVIGNILADLAQYGEAEEQLRQQVAAGERTQAQADQELATLRARNVASALDGIKSLFKQHSTAYKAMEAAERAYALLQTVNTIKYIAAGAAKMFAQLGVWAFPAVAAMVAVLAGLGFSGGTSAQKAPASPEDLQKAAGAGTVLGDPSAKSASIANALELMAKNSTKGLDYSSEMVASLRAISNSIGSLAASIARSLDLSGGFFDTTGKTGTNSSGGFLGMFASTKTTSLYDQGFQFNPATVEQIMENGIAGATYQVIETVKQNSGFLGLGSSTKTSYSTTTGAVDGDISRQIQLVIGQLDQSVVEAAKVLGLDVADALKTFQVEIGKISFKDLTGQQITDELNAIFSKIGDQMAGFAVSGLEQFQKAGEGLFETLMRLAKDYLTIDAALKSIGMTFGAVGASSIAARESLIDLAGGLDAFVDQVNFFYDHFLTDAQKVAYAQQQVDAAFQALGIAEPTTLGGFASLVKGLDLSTDAGQQMFEALMQIAPAFYEVATAADQLAQKQQELQVQLLQAQGKTAEATALERQLALAALDPALRALQQQIYAAQDIATARDNLAQAYKNEASSLQQTIDKFRGFAATLKAFRDQLFASGPGGQSYNQALANLMRVGGLASSGDETALGQLQDVSQQYLSVAEGNARTLTDYRRAQSLVAKYLDQSIGASNGIADSAQMQLDVMHDQVSKLVDIDDHVLSVAEAIEQLTALMFPSSATAAGGETGGGTGSGAFNGKKLDQILDHLAEITSNTAAGAVAANVTARVIKNADRGGAIALVTDSDSPIATVSAS